MRSRSSLFLMEMLIAVLVFSFSAAITVSIFTSANSLSMKSTETSAAVVNAANAAELFKSGVKEITSTYESGGNKYQVVYSGSITDNVEAGEISVVAPDGEILYSLNVARVVEVSA